MENLKHGSGIVDLAIIGGGPAGSAAALEARRLGLRVAMWERDRFPRDKVCGEFISSEALPLLQNEIPRTMARGAEIHCAELISGLDVARTFRLPRAALGLSRRLLDAALWKAAETAGVDAYVCDCVRKVQQLAVGPRQNAMWEIESAGAIAQRAKALIVACGRWWKVEGLSSPAGHRVRAAPADWIGLKAHFAGIPSRKSVEMYFFRGGYCGLAPVEDGICNVCCLVHGERFRECGMKRLEDFAASLVQISQLPSLKKRLCGATQISPVVTTAPVNLARRQAVQNGALMVGDASGFLDPFTGEGISMALHSGRLAAHAVATALSEGFDGQRAALIYGQGLSQAVRRSYTIAAVARGLLRGPKWLQGLVAAPVPWAGRYLFNETRWHGGGELNRL